MKNCANTRASQLNSEMIVTWKFAKNDTEYITIADTLEEAIKQNTNRYGVEKKDIKIINSRMILKG